MKKSILLIMILVLSCSKDDHQFIEEPIKDKVEEEVDPFLHLSASEIRSNSEAGETKFTLTSNTDWSVSRKSEWIQLSSNSGNGTSQISVSWSKNDSFSERTGEVVFEAGNIDKKVVFTQASFDLELVDFTSKNGSPEIFKEKYLLFNKPVTVNSISSGEERYSFLAGEEDVEYFNNNMGIRFTAGPADLGREYKYKFSVQDLDGNWFEDVVTLSFYTEKIILPGLIKKVILDDENNLWVLTLNHNNVFKDVDRIYKFSTSGGAIEEELSFNLDLDSYQSYHGGDFFINPYNNLIYVPDYIGNEIEVYTKSGDLVKKIKMQSDELDHPDYPAIYPRAIGFNMAGKGLVSLGNPGNSGNRWKFIDSSKDDLITSAGRDHEGIYNNSYMSFDLNYDKTKLFTVGSRSNFITVYDENGNFNEEIDLSDYYSSADMSHIEPNKLNNKIYVNGLYNQQIISMDGSYHSGQTRDQGYLADFSYKEDHENIVYALSSDNIPYLNLLDYGNEKTIFSYPAASFFNWTKGRDILTTTDNRFVILYSEFTDNHTTASQIVFLDTEMFKIE